MERRQAEEELRTWGECFCGAFQHAATGIVVNDFEGRFVAVNRAFCEITGYTEAELTARDFLSITHPQDIDRDAHLWREVLGGKTLDYRLEKRYCRKDGGAVWVRISVSTLPDDHHRPLGTIGLVEDIGDRKQAEEALHELSGRLLQLQDEERRRLAQALHTSTVQTLAATSMNLSVMSESIDCLTERGRRALVESMVLVKRCADEIRTLAYLMHPPELDHLDLASALESYVDSFAQRSGIRVHLDVPASVGRLSRELELALFRIVQEALANIHRHSGSTTAGIRIVRNPREVLMEISDQGRGLPGGNGTKHAIAGVGIAAMAHRARQLGGHLEVQSERGGTIVTAVIPTVEAKNADPA